MAATRRVLLSALFTSWFMVAGCAGCESSLDHVAGAEVLERIAQRIGGRVTANDVSFDRARRTLTLKGARLERNDGSMRYQGGDLVLTLADGAGDGLSRLAIEGGELVLQKADSRTTDLATETVLNDVQVLVNRSDAPALDARVHSLVLRTDGDERMVRAELSSAALGDLQVDRVALSGTVTGRTLKADAFEVTVGSDILVAKALNIGFAPMRMSSAVVEGSAPVALLTALLESPLKTALEGSVQFRKPVDIRNGALALETAFTLREGRVRGQALWSPALGTLTPEGDLYRLTLRPDGDGEGSVTVTAHTAETVPANVGPALRVSFTDLPLAHPPPALEAWVTPKSTATGECVLDPPEARARCTAAITQLSLKLGLLSLTASRVELEGALFGPQAEDGGVQMRFPEGARLNGVAVTHASAVLDSLEHPQKLRSVSATGPLATLSSDLLQRVDGGDGQHWQGTVRVQRLELAAAFSLLTPDLAKLLQLSGVGQGTVTLPADHGRPITTELLLSDVRMLGGRFDGGRAHFERRQQTGAAISGELSLRQGKANLTVAGQVAGKASNIEVSAHKLAIESPLDGSALEVSLAGRLSSTNSRVAGTATRGAQLPPIDFELISSDAESALCDPAAKAPRQTHRLCVRGRQGTTSLDLGLSLWEGGVVEGRATLRGYDLWPEGTGPRGELLLSGTATLRASSLSQLGRASGDLHLKTLTLRFMGESLDLEQENDYALRDGQVKLAGAVLRGPVGSLKLTGSVGRAGELTGQAQLKAERLAHHLPGLSRASGLVDAQLSVTDHISARATLDDLVLHPQVGPTLRAVRGRLRYDQRGLHLEGVQARVEEGQLHADGLLSSGGETQVALRLTDVRWQPKERLSLRMSAEGSLTQEPDDALPLLDLDVKLQEVRYGRRIQFPEVILAAKDAAQGDARDADVRLRLDIEQTGPWQIENGVLKVRLASPQGLVVRGTNSRFGVRGDLQVAEGSIHFYNDDFTLGRSRIAFEDDQKLSARFDLRGQAPARRRKDAHIELRAKGDDDAFALQVQCKAADEAPVPPRFRCDFDGQELRCPDYTELAALWACAPP